MQIIDFKINNTVGSLNSPVVTSTSGIVFNWTASSSPGVYQKHSEINIGTSINGLGSNDFVGNLFSQNFQDNTAYYFELGTSQPLSRGKIYYGQLRIKDNLSIESDYEVFSFKINTYPFVTSASYVPEKPSLSEDLSVDYVLSKSGSSARILWYKNGELQSHLSDFTTIPLASLRVGQSWNAEITPYDGVDVGERLSLPIVDIQQEIPVVDYVKIIPERATENDILTIDYSIAGSESGSIIRNKSENQIMWHVNGVEFEDFNNFQSARIKTKPGDKIKCIITPVYDGTFGDPVETEEVTIVSSGFRVRDLTVEGKSENLNINTDSPLIDWDTTSPFGRDLKYVKVNVGTYWGADNLIGEVIDSFDSFYKVPSGILRQGGDYYVSVAVSDDRDNFQNFSYAHFRMRGSLWKTYVDNSRGWVTRFVIKSSSVDLEKDGYYDIQINDGTRFFSVSIFSDRIVLNETSGGPLSEDVNLEDFVEIIISARNDKVSVYLNGESLKFGTTNIEFAVNSTTSERSIRILPLSLISGSESNDDIFPANLTIKEFNYLLDSIFEESRLEMSNMSFVRHLNVSGQSIDFLDYRDGKYFASLNPQDINASGKIIEIDPSANSIMASAKSLDEMDISVNNILQSPSGNKIIFDHSQGASIISGNVIAKYDVDTYFGQSEKLENDYWKTISTPGSIAYRYESGGLIIDTTSKNIGRYDDVINPDIEFYASSVFSISATDTYQGLVVNEFKIVGDEFIIHETNETIPEVIDFSIINLLGKTIGAVVSEINNTPIVEDSSLLISDLYEIRISDGYSEKGTSILADSDGWQRITSLSDPARFHTESSVILSDEVDPDPYSYTSGGKCFFFHNRPGTNWFDYVDSDIGYTVDLDVVVNKIEDSRRSISTETDDGFGIYLNDGRYKETIEFRNNEIIFKNFNESVPFDFSNKVSFRFTGKMGKLRVFSKKEGESSYSLIQSASMSVDANSQSSASSPCVAIDSAGIEHVLWHDDSKGGRGRLWYSYFSESEWSKAVSVAESNFGFSNANIEIDNENNLHVIFESSGSDYSDIAYIMKNNKGWSNPVIVASEIKSSSLPKIAIDEGGNTHIAWQDNRYDKYDIFYAYRDGESGQWSSSAFGGKDVQISLSDNGAFHPDIVANNNFVFVAWSEELSTGGSNIKVAKLDRNSSEWKSSAADGFDFQVDSINNTSSDYPSIVTDIDGNLHVVWHDINNGNYEIFWRKVSSSLTGISDIIQLTSSSKSSRYPKIATSNDNGNIFVVFQREDLSILDPYSSLSLSQDNLNQESTLHYSAYSAIDKKWRSSNSEDFVAAFDYAIGFYNTRIVSSSNVPKKFSGNMSIVYSASIVHDFTDRFSQRDIFDNTYYASINSDLQKESKVQVGVDPYLVDDMIVSGMLDRKEIRVGDFSDSISGKMNIKYIRYSTSYAVDPFSIRLINSSTSNSNGEFSSYLVNDFGDMWVTSDRGLEFYDFNKNSFFVLTSSDLIDEVGFTDISGGLSNLVVDNNNVMFVVVIGGGIHMTIDHFHFHKLDLSATSIANQNGDSVTPDRISFDKNNNLILVYEDSIFIVYNIEKYTSLIPSGDGGEVIVVAEEDVKKLVSNISGRSLSTGRIEVDDLNVIWIPFRDGLLKLTNNNVALYGKEDGLRGGEVLSVSIKSSSHRFICCENAIYEMIGDQINRINLRNSEISPISLNEERTQEAYSVDFIANKYAFWTKYNSLLISSLSKVVQLSYLDEKFNTKKIGITQFKSSDYALVDEFSSSNYRQNFSIEGYDDIYEYRDFFNVLINGHRVSSGYYFNPFSTQLSFDSPILPTDLVEIELQPGISVRDDFTPNNAEILALGTIVRRPKKLGFQNSNRRVMLIDGSSNGIFIDDVITQRPFDSIVLDREPPIAKLTINRVAGPRVLNLKVENLVGSDGVPIPYDAVSGIDKMIISNFDNFTSNGQDFLDPVPFKSNVDHEIGDVISSSSLVKEFTSEVGSSVAEFRASGSEVKSIYFAASNPASLYKQNDDGSISLIHLFDEDTDDAVISFLTVFQNDLIIAVGSPGGIGKIYKTNDVEEFSFVGSVSQNYIKDFTRSPYDQLLYLAAGNESDGVGAVYRYDGDVVSLYRDDLSQSVNAITSFDRFLYLATGDSGTIYRLDVVSEGSEIVHIDSISTVSSISNIGVIVYAGFNSGGKIIRSSNVDSPFVTSFTTLPSSVNKIKTILESDGEGNEKEVVYAAVDNNLFKFVNAWTSVIQTTSPIIDFMMDSNNVLWVVSEDKIQKIINNNIGTAYVYLKMIDRAGNETSLFSDPDEDGDGYNDNLVSALDIDTLRQFTNSNRILELNEMGEIIFDHDGDARFYSADRIVREVGVFYTEVFNATNNHVSWDKITWESSIPENTDIKFYIRVGVNRNELLESDFDLSLNNSDEGFNLSFLNGQFLQVKAVLISYARDITPSLYKINVTSLATEASHLFTTNFILPSRIKRGILTADKFIPVSADIIFGISTNNSTEFNDYQIIGENRLFTTDSQQLGSGLRVGVRLLTPQVADQAVSPPVEYGPYGYGVDINSVEWNYINTETVSRTLNFSVSFYVDVELSSLLFESNTIDNPELFKVNGDSFPVGDGYSIASEETMYVSFIPKTDSPLVCDREYFTKIDLIEESVSTAISDERTFINQCGVSFIDKIQFDFQNLGDIQIYDFRIKFYLNENRTNLFKSYFSGNNPENWFVGNAPFPSTGETFLPGDTKTVEFSPSLVDDGFVSGLTYYLSIDAFDGDSFISQNNSYTFRAQDLSGDDIICGPYSDVPILRSFAIMFELEDGEFVKFNVVN